ncbi:MAG: radical SAM protein [Candidatus Woesearchaeota archaeon]|nr:radical SAM protein [Candidatus Woesearchaeota archaeon]
MAKLEFESLSFEEENDFVRVSLLKIFYFQIPKIDLNKIGDFVLSANSIDFRDVSMKKAGNKFNMLIQKHIPGLKNKITGRKTVYVHQNSGIPLIGSNYFGIVDRGTSLIEIKPINGCNLNCIYCSVDEGRESKTRLVDFVVEKDYLVAELRKVVDFKCADSLEIHIAGQSEPLLYDDVVPLVKEISQIREVKVVSMDTNGTLLTKKLVDKLIKAGLTRFHMSINSLDPELATKIAGAQYNISHVKKMAEYIVKKAEVIITPIWIEGVNDKEIPKLVEFADKIKADIGIQNFLRYKHGRNPAKQMEWSGFYDKLKALEKRFNVKLIKSEEDFNIIKTKELPKPLKKDESVKVKIVAEGRLRDEKIAVYDNKVISVFNCSEAVNETVKVRILRTKHNIFVGKKE